MSRSAQQLNVFRATIILIVALIVVASYPLYHTDAATGIHKRINFQGKLTNPDGTNVTDGDYDITFTLYDDSSAGTNLWDEVQTVTVTNGLFRVELGSVDTTLGNVDFNSDLLYLGIKVETDNEMTPRVRFTAVPYAFNAEKVNGLTVTNNGGNTLNIAANKTFRIDNSLTFTGTDSKTFNFPNLSGASDDIVTEDFAQTLTNKTIGSTGLTFSGAGTDITTATDETLTLTGAGNGIISLNDTVSLPTYAGNNAVLFANHTSGNIGTATTSTSGQCLISGAAAGYQPTWGSCSGGATAWDDLGDPSTNLSLNMGTTTTAFSWATGTSTNNLFSLATASDSNGTGALLRLDAPGTTNTIMPLRITANGVEALSVSASGNVGIGVTDATQKLHVDGRIRTDGGMLFNEGSAATDNLFYVGSESSEAVDASFGFFTAGVDSANSLYGPYFLSRGNLFSAIANQRGNMYFNAGTPVTPGVSEGRLVFTTDNDTPRMVIDRTGNIGIGNTQPAVQLEVGDITLGVDAANGVGIQGDLEVEDFALLNAVRIGSTATDPGNGQLFVEGASTFDSDVDLTLAGSENLTVGNTTLNSASNVLNLSATITGNVSADLLNLTVTNNSGAGTNYGMQLTNADNGGNTAVIDAMALFTNNQATETIADGVIIRHNVGSGTLTDGLQIENTTAGGTISNAINILETAGTVTTGINIGNNVGTGLVFGTGQTTEISFADTTPVISVADGGSITFNDGTTAIFVLADVSTASNHVLSGDSNTGLQISGATTDLTTASNEDLTITASGTGNVVVGVDGDTTMTMTFGAAPDADMFAISNSGQGVTSTGRDGLDLTYAVGVTSAGADNAGLRLTVASSNTSASSIEAIDIANLSGAHASVTETAVKVGTGWDVGVSVASGGISVTGGNITLSGGGTFTLSGSSLRSKTMTLSPEYPGAILSAFNGSTTDTNITGSMTSDMETSATNSLRTYYQWERTTDATLHYYTVAVRAKLPSDFASWQTSNALQVNFVTDTTGTTANVLDVRVYLESDSTIPVASSTGNASGTADTWSTVTVDDSTLDDGTLSEWDAAGETAIIYLRMGSASSEHVRVGDIILNYLASY